MIVKFIRTWPPFITVYYLNLPARNGDSQQPAKAIWQDSPTHQQLHCNPALVCLTNTLALKKVFSQLLGRDQKLHSRSKESFLLLHIVCWGMNYGDDFSSPEIRPGGKISGFPLLFSLRISVLLLQPCSANLKKKVHAINIEQNTWNRTQRSRACHLNPAPNPLCYFATLLC